MQPRSYQLVYRVIHHFHSLNVEIKENLTQGVLDIEAEEAKHGQYPVNASFPVPQSQAPPS